MELENVTNFEKANQFSVYRMKVSSIGMNDGFFFGTVDQSLETKAPNQK